MTDDAPCSTERANTQSTRTGPDAAESARPSTGTAVAMVLTVVVLGWANRGTVSQWFTRWLEENSVGAGFLLVATAAWIACRERGSLVRADRPRLLGIVLIYMGFVGKLAGQLLVMPVPDRLGLYLQLVGMVVLWYGFSGVVAWWRPLLLLLAAIPIPVAVQGRIYPLLGEAAMFVIVPMVEIAGLSVIPGQGGSFTAFGGTSELQFEAVQMPFYFGALALVLGCVRGRGILGVILLVVCALPILIACNGARSVVAALAGVDVAAKGMAPVVLSWAMLPVALAVLLLIDRLALGRRGSPAS